MAGSQGAQRSRAGAGLAWALTPALTLDPGREQVPGGGAAAALGASHAEGVHSGQ